MTFREVFDHGLQSTISWLIVAVLGGGWWLVRRIFTNQQQIKELRQELQAREEMRERDRADLREVKGDVKDLRKDIRALFINHGDG